MRSLFFSFTVLENKKESLMFFLGEWKWYDFFFFNEIREFNINLEVRVNNAKM